MQSTKKAPKKGIRFLLMVFGGILAVLLLAVAILFTIPLIEGVDAAPVDGSAGWMARLPDDVSLGWTVVDFGSARLASAIYEQNF